MNKTDLIFVYTSLGGMVIFIITIVTLALKAKTYIDQKFSDLKKLMFDNFEPRDKAIRRIEFHLVRTSSFQPANGPYQPAADPPELTRADKRK